MALNKGWLYLDYGGTEVRFRCEEIDYDEEDKGSINVHYPSDGHFGFTTDTQHRKVKAKNIWVTTIADWNLLKVKLKALQTAGVAFNIRYKIASTPSWEQFDGTNEIMPVIIKKVRGKKKLYRGDTTIFMIKQIIFEQAGALTTV